MFNHKDLSGFCLCDKLHGAVSQEKAKAQLDWSYAYKAKAGILVQRCLKWLGMRCRGSPGSQSWPKWQRVSFQLPSYRFDPTTTGQLIQVYSFSHLAACLQRAMSEQAQEQALIIRALQECNGVAKWACCQGQGTVSGTAQTGCFSGS